MKQITVLGANGRVGSLIVQNLLAEGYRVVAFVHKARDMQTTDLLTVIEGDVHDGTTVREAVEGSDAVISALGSWGTSKKDTQRTAMMYLVAAMHEKGIRRVISLTGSEARAEGDQLSLIHRAAHLMAGVFAGKILLDGEVHIKQLERSNLDWTVIRSPVMNENDSTEFILNDTRPLPWRTIHRHAVARAMVEQLDDTRFIAKAPFINR